MCWLFTISRLIYWKKLIVEWHLLVTSGTFPCATSFVSLRNIWVYRETAIEEKTPINIFTLLVVFLNIYCVLSFSNTLFFRSIINTLNNNYAPLWFCFKYGHMHSCYHNNSPLLVRDIHLSLSEIVYILIHVLLW